MINNSTLRRHIIFLFILFVAQTAFGRTFTNTELATNCSFNIHAPLTLQNNTAHERHGHAHISFLKDSTGQQFILKCNYSSQKSIHDAVGAHVGSSVNIPINKIKIIPPHIKHIGKNDDACVATLHTLAPGIEVANLAQMNLAINLYHGLHESSLLTITQINGLIDILALDLFLDNYDRHNYNLFFDTQTNSFHAIDMDCTFSNALLPEKSIQDLLRYLYNNNVAKDANCFIQCLRKNMLSAQEIKALKRLSATLKVLKDTYPPKKLYDVWMSYAQKADYSYSIKKRVYIFSLILYNYYRVSQLIKSLDALIIK